MSWTGPADADQADRLAAGRCARVSGLRLGTRTHTRYPVANRLSLSERPPTTMTDSYR